MRRGIIMHRGIIMCTRGVANYNGHRNYMEGNYNGCNQYGIIMRKIGCTTRSGHYNTF